MMGKVLVTKSAASSAMNAINSFTAPHKTGWGGVLGGAMGGLGALNALGNASESQQDIFGGAQQVAQAGITGYYGGARAGDAIGETAPGKTIENKVTNLRDRAFSATPGLNRYGVGAAHKNRMNQEGMADYSQGAASNQSTPSFDASFFDPVDAQQTAMSNLSSQHQQTGGQYGGNRPPSPSVPGRVYGASDPANLPENQGFNVPEGFQLGVYGTPMGGGNQAIQGQKGIQPNLFNPKQPAAPTGLGAAGLGNIDPTMLQNVAPNPDVRAGQSYADQVYQTPTGSGGVTPMSMEEMGQMLPGTGQPPVAVTGPGVLGSSQVGVPASALTPPEVANMDPEQTAAFFASQHQMKNTSEPFEIAFRLLKSVVV